MRASTLAVRAVTFMASAKDLPQAGTDFRLEIEESPELASWLEDRLYEFNVGATGFSDGTVLAFRVRDTTDRIVAGLAGHTWGGCCDIRQLWVDEACRRRGLGSRLLAAAEAEARRRGCSQIVLSTHSFQAPDFYRRHGFREIARIEDYPRGHQNLLLRKSFV